MGRFSVRRNSSNRSIESREGVHGLYREIRAQRNSSPAIDECAESIEVLDAFRPLVTPKLIYQVCEQ